jgi:ribosome recycling factor
MSEVKASAAGAAAGGGAEVATPIRPMPSPPATIESVAELLKQVLQELKEAQHEAREARREAQATRRLLTSHCDDARFERQRADIRHAALLDMLKDIIGRLP